MKSFIGSFGVNTVNGMYPDTVTVITDEKSTVNMLKREGIIHGETTCLLYSNNEKVPAKGIVTIKHVQDFTLVDGKATLQFTYTDSFQSSSPEQIIVPTLVEQYMWKGSICLVFDSFYEDNNAWDEYLRSKYVQIRYNNRVYALKAIKHARHRIAIEGEVSAQVISIIFMVYSDKELLSEDEIVDIIEQYIGLKGVQQWKLNSLE